MKPSLLIAGAGYLGTEIARQAEATYQVTTLTKSGDLGNLAGDLGSLAGDYSNLACDLSDPAQVAALTATCPHPEIIIHCASSGRGGPEAYRDVFIKGTTNLLQSFPHSHLILTSSTSVYHQTDGSPVDESSPTSPIRETSQLLLQAEQIVLKNNGTVARLAGLYGPGRSAILRKFLDQSAVIEDTGQRILNQIHLVDAASATLHLAAKKTKGIYNIADNTPITQLECYQGLATHFATPLPPTGEKNTSRKRAWTHKKVLNAKIRATGWAPTYPAFIDSLPSLTS